MSILFDLDGTLLDTAPDFIHAVNLLRSELKMPPLDKHLLDNIRIAVSGGIRELLIAGLALPPGHSDLQNPFTGKLGKRLIEIYQENIACQTRFFPGIENLLNTLEQKNIAWGIVTNKATIHTHSLLTELGILKRTNCVVCGDTTPFSKPHPEPLLHASRLIKANPKRCVYIGDAERDIIAGKAAGMATIGALFGYIENREIAKSWGADHYILHPDEILPWFEKWQQQQT